MPRYEFSAYVGVEAQDSETAQARLCAFLDGVSEWLVLDEEIEGHPYIAIDESEPSEVVQIEEDEL